MHFKKQIIAYNALNHAADNQKTFGGALFCLKWYQIYL